MKLDDTLRSIIEQIIVEVKDKYGIHLTLEEVYNVIDSQIEATKIGFAKGISVHWIKFGKFLLSKRGDRKREVTRYVEDLEDDSTDLTQEEKDKRKKEFIIIKAEERKQTLTIERAGNIKHSLNYIKSTENPDAPSKLPILRIITKPKPEEDE